jgi:ectoine hydroxylase-related dioxygenase (phytanoyl-CoA dioxygenase family)
MPPTAEHPPTSQPVHSDADFDHPDHPFAYVVNVPLITMTPENGSTEVWLGTHANTGLHVQEGRHGERASSRIRQEDLDNRRAIRPPCQPIVPKGSIVVRDLRLWHAGMGNRTDTIRVMLAMSKSVVKKRKKWRRSFWLSVSLAIVHFAPWYRNPMKLRFADDLKGIIESQKSLDLPVEWMTEAEGLAQYLHRGYGNAYDFNQTP